MVAFTVRETLAGYQAGSGLPSEAVLARLWAGQRFPTDALVTLAGAHVHVLHPGLRGRGAGPDFRHARVRMADGLVRIGDVELHVRATDFRAHGHHTDKRYDHVVLHVVFEDDIGADTLLSSGRRVPVVALAPWARRRAQDLSAWLLRPERWRQPCHDAVQRIGVENVRATLEALGQRRFEDRVAALASKLEEKPGAGVLYEALLEGVSRGGGHGSDAYLMHTLPWSVLEPALADGIETEALLLGSAGWLPSQQGAHASGSYEILLEAGWQAAGITSHVDPPTSSQRPANHPARRLAALACLLKRHAGLLAGSGALAEALSLSNRSLIQEWTVPANEYWRAHVAPGRLARRSPGALIGRSRAIELLVNAVLPWATAVAYRAGDPRVARLAHSQFGALPTSARYGRLAFLEEHLSHDGERLNLSARRQQGLLALYKQECTQGGCGSCPFS